jgi:hypothetical protein
MTFFSREHPPRFPADRPRRGNMLSRTNPRAGKERESAGQVEAGLYGARESAGLENCGTERDSGFRGTGNKRTKRAVAALD